MRYGHYIALTALVALLALPACAQNNGFTFDAPGGWRTVYAAGNTHLLAPDGSRYTMLWSSHMDASPDTLRSAAVKNIAEQLASPLLKSMTFSGAQSVKIDGGTAAFFRFDGLPNIGPG